MLLLKLVFCMLLVHFGNCFNFTSDSPSDSNGQYVKIKNPQIPYSGTVPGSVQQLKKVRIQGIAPTPKDTFSINLQAGPSIERRDDIALHLAVRLKTNKIIRNAFQSGKWGDEHYEVGAGRMPIRDGQQFEVVVLLAEHEFKIAINGKHYTEFPYRIPRDRISHLVIVGDVVINLISWEELSPQDSDDPPNICDVCSVYKCFNPR